MTVILSKSVVKKTFLPKDAHLFYNEIYWLEKLKNYDFIPKIKNIDVKQFTISITNEGKKINSKNKPKNWQQQLKDILEILKQNDCFHSDIKSDNLLVKQKRLKLIDFAQSIKISDFKKKLFFKKRIFYDSHSINRIKLSIEKNLITSNDLRVLIVWDEKNDNYIHRKLKQNKNIEIIDKIKLRKDFYTAVYKDRIFWIDQFYNKKISKTSNKLKNNIFVYIIRSLNPIFKSNKMIFSNENKIVDHKIFSFKKKIRKNELSLVHISDNFEESKRNAVLLSKTKYDFPAKYFYNTQHIYKSEKDFFSKLNNKKKLKYVVLRNKKSKNEDLDILVNDYYLFKRTSDCHSYKKKNLNLISNSGDPVEEDGIKVANYIKIKKDRFKIDVRFVGDKYFDIPWQKQMLSNRQPFSFYFVLNDENLIFSILYHIVYHKGYIDEKYKKLLIKKLKIKNLELNSATEIINNYLFKKKYKITRPTDLTIPITYQMDDMAIKNEIILVKNQMNRRNYSGTNKMIYNLFKYQKNFKYLRKDIFILLFLNQIYLFKNRIKNTMFKYFNRNNFF